MNMARAFTLFGRAGTRAIAHELYRRLVAQARRPEFFERGGLADRAENRFEVVALHAFLVMRRLKGEGRTGKHLSQQLFDLMFADLDQTLREAGAGDLGVGRRVKALAGAFLGRVRAYDSALVGDGDEALRAALSRNLFAGANPGGDQLRAMADYVRREADQLARQRSDDVLAGRLAFGPPPAYP
ncbi:MAG: ubiquinol-cytochrome C chaperone family protein [Alphaproteobacteria bacterium]